MSTARSLWASWPSYWRPQWASFRRCSPIMASASTSMTTRPKFFLLDAMVVSELHAQGIWARFIRAAEVVVPALIAGEAHCYTAKDGTVRATHIDDDITAGRVAVADCDAEELQNVLRRFEQVLQESLHLGEIQAFVLLLKWEGDPPSFCTADFKAVEAT